MTLPSLIVYADGLYCRAWLKGEGSLKDLEGIVRALEELAILRAEVKRLKEESVR